MIYVNVCHKFDSVEIIQMWLNTMDLRFDSVQFRGNSVRLKFTFLCSIEVLQIMQDSTFFKINFLLLWWGHHSLLCRYSCINLSSDSGCSCRSSRCCW